jgi:mannose-6-phosphate isomerase-like protein (cupin superfamily)
MTQQPRTLEEWYIKSSYQDFVQREEAPLYEGSCLVDLLNLPLAPWKRRGGKVAYTRLGDQEVNSLQIVEVPPGGELKPQHHMYDALMYVLQGRGATSIWQQGEPKHTVEWQEGSLLAVPLNAWHQEFNASGTEPCRMLFGTNMAQAINHYHSLDFIFNCPYAFTDRYSASVEDFFAGEGKHWGLRIFETNFIPDVRKMVPDPWPERGRQTSIMRISMASTSLGLHRLDVAMGTYATAHRHGAGAHVMVIGGEGYELFFFPGEEMDPEKQEKVWVKPYSVVAPKSNQYHQHFNTGTEPFRQLAFRGGGVRYGTGTAYDPVGAARADNPYAYSFKLSHDKEDPRIRQEYYQELEKRGISLRLEPVDQGAS